MFSKLQVYFINISYLPYLLTAAYVRNILKWFDQYDYRNIRIWAGPLPYVLFMETPYVEVSQLGF